VAKIGFGGGLLEGNHGLSQSE